MGFRLSIKHMATLERVTALEVWAVAVPHGRPDSTSATEYVPFDCTVAVNPYFPRTPPKVTVRPATEPPFSETVPLKSQQSPIGLAAWSVMNSGAPAPVTVLSRVRRSKGSNAGHGNESDDERLI